MSDAGESVERTEHSECHSLACHSLHCPCFISGANESDGWKHAAVMSADVSLSHLIIMRLLAGWTPEDGQWRRDGFDTDLAIWHPFYVPMTEAEQRMVKDAQHDANQGFDDDPEDMERPDFGRDADPT